MNSVAPNSPRARANASTIPAAMLDHDSGSISRTKIFALLHPSVRAASSMLRSRLSNAPSALRYISGNATTTAAMTHAAGLKMSGKPVSIQNRPNAVFEPHAKSRMKPHTVGGSTMGMVKMASKMLFARELRFRQKYAANKPRMTMNTMAMPVVRRLTHSGLQSRFCRNSPAAAKPVGLATMLTWSAGAITPKSANEGLA